MFSYLSQEKKKKEDGKTNVEEEEGKVKILKKQRDETNNLKEKIVSELLRSQTSGVEEQKEDTDDLLRVLGLLEKRSNECERELDAHKRLFSIMIGGSNVHLGKEEDEEKEEMRDITQKKRNNVRLDTLKYHTDKEKMEQERVKLKAMNTQMMQLLGLDQSGDNKGDKDSDKEEKVSLAKKRRIEEEDTLDSLLEGLKKKGKKIKK